MRTIAIVNQKGGSGKTTTAINLSAVLAANGHRTLLIDMDPQSHCAAGLGVPEERIERSSTDALLSEPHKLPARDGLVWNVARDLDLIPSTMRLAALEAAEGGLHARPDKELRLRKFLDAFAGEYEFVIIDCPPTIGLLTFNALMAAEEAIVPVETGYFALRGAEKQRLTIDRLGDRIGRRIECRLLATIHDERTKLAREVLTAMSRRFGAEMLPVTIGDHHVLREAAGFGQPVSEYAPQSPAHREFLALAEIVVAESPRPRGGSGAVRRRAGAATGGATATMEPAAFSTLEAEELDDLAEEVRRRATAQDGDTGSNGDRDSIAIAPARPRTARPAYGAINAPEGVVFTQPAVGATSMAIAGAFNHWKPEATPMHLVPDRGVFEAAVSLPPGRYEYRLVVDGKWFVDPFNPEQVPNEFGQLNSVARVGGAA